MKFGDEGGKAVKGDLISYIRPDPIAATQYDWFAPKNSSCFNPGRTFKTFFYSILGAQVTLGVASLEKVEERKRARLSS